MKLSNTTAQNSFKYGWLLKRVFPYIRPYLFRIFCGFLVAVPLGLLDGVTAFALKPFMDYVVGKQDWVFHVLGNEYTLNWQLFAFIIPFGVVAFAALQGLLRYLNDYLSAWTSQRITNDVKFDLFHRLIHSVVENSVDFFTSKQVCTTRFRGADLFFFGVYLRIMRYITQLRG